MSDEIFRVLKFPSVEELLTSFRLGNEGSPVNITVKRLSPRVSELTFAVKVLGMSKESGSTTKWRLQLQDESAHLGFKLLDGYCDTQTRTGHLRSGY